MVEQGGVLGEEYHDAEMLTGKMRQFILQLAEWDQHLVEVFLLEEMRELTSDEDTLTLICTFDPEPVNDSVGFFLVVNLLVRSKFEDLQESIGLDNPVDLGLRIGKDIFLPGGKVMSLPDRSTVLWPDHGNYAQ